jgi:hypothetical protein
MQGAHAPSSGGAAEPVEAGEQAEDVQLTDGQGQPMTYTAEQIKALNRDQVWRAGAPAVSLQRRGHRATRHTVAPLLCAAVNSGR